MLLRSIVRLSSQDFPNRFGNSMIGLIQIQTGLNVFKTGLSQADIYTNNAQG
jgi:hypothetical protein